MSWLVAVLRVSLLEMNHDDKLKHIGQLLAPFRFETRRAVVTKMKSFVFEVRRLHLNRQVVDAKSIVKLGAQLF